LAESLKPTALKVFKYEYLLDFIAGDELEDEMYIEQQMVLNIRNFDMLLSLQNIERETCKTMNILRLYLPR